MNEKIMIKNTKQNLRSRDESGLNLFDDINRFCNLLIHINLDNVIKLFESENELICKNRIYDFIVRPCFISIFSQKFPWALNNNRICTVEQKLGILTYFVFFRN